MVRDTGRDPSPPRAVVSGHSTTACGVAAGGTLVDLRGLDRLVAIGEDTIAAEFLRAYNDF